MSRQQTQQEIRIPQAPVHLPDEEENETIQEIQKERMVEHRDRRKKKMRRRQKVESKFHVAKKFFRYLGVEKDSHFRQDDEEGTMLVETGVWKVRQSPQVFSDVYGSGDEDIIPVVLRPKWLFWTMVTVIPTGCFAIISYFGKVPDVKKAMDIEETALGKDMSYTPPGCLSPGIHFMPPGKYISHIITRNHVPFDHPVKMCPTLDSVFVSIDTLIMFQIVNPVRFISLLGPYKLTDLLESFMEESVRSLARQSTYEEVYDIKGENLESMVRDLNQKLKFYGVHVSQVLVTQIELPEDLKQSMINITLFDSKEALREVTKGYHLSSLRNDENYLDTKVKRENELLKKQANDYKGLQIVKKYTHELQQITQKRIGQIKAMTDGETAKILEQSKLEEATLIQNKDNLIKKLKKEGQRESSIIKAKEFEYKEIQESKVQLELANNRAKALSDVANAEGKAKVPLKNLRDYNQAKKKIEILNGLCDNKDCVITGSSNYNAFAQISKLNQRNILPPQDLMKYLNIPQENTNVQTQQRRRKIK